MTAPLGPAWSVAVLWCRGNESWGSRAFEIVAGPNASLARHCGLYDEQVSEGRHTTASRHADRGCGRAGMALAVSLLPDLGT